MKKLYILILLIQGTFLFSQAQKFEGTISWIVTPDSSDMATRKEMEEVEKVRASAKHRYSLKAPEIVEYLQKNPERKAYLESYMLRLATKANIITLFPDRYSVQIKGYNSLTKIKGGIFEGSEILSLKEKNASYRINHYDSTFMVLPASDKKGNVEVTKTKNMEKILGYNCTKYIFTITVGETTTENEIWLAPPKDLNLKQLAQYPHSGFDNSYLEKIDGVPLRMKINMGQTKFIIEATSIVREKLDDSLFDIPPWYKKVEAMF